MEETSSKPRTGTAPDSLRKHTLAETKNGLETEHKPASGGGSKRGPRTRMARWETIIGIQTWRFAYDPGRGVLTVRRKHTRRSAALDITMPELIEALDGQRLLPVSS